jgi:hypothetical protein
MVTKRTQVILVSIINLFGFVLQVFATYAATGTSIYCFESTIYLAISFIWLCAFTVTALRHSKEPYYPAVAITVITWPSFAITFFAITLFARYLGFKF